MPTWVWFVIAVLAAGGGALLLWSDSARSGGSSRDRRRWAEEKSWEFTDADPVLPSRWRHGAIAQGGPGRALDLATGAVPGPGGRRLAHVFDHEQAGQVTGIVAAVRGVAALPAALELRLPSAPLPDDAALDSLGQVGDRYAFVDHAAEARPLITPDLARAADDVGADVPLLWAEESWVLATIAAGTGTERVQALLQSLVEVSVALEDAADGDPGAIDDADDTATGVIGSPAAVRASRDEEIDDPRSTRGTDDRSTDARSTAGRSTDEHSTDDYAEYDDDLDDMEIEDLEDDDRRGPRPTHRDRPGDIPYDIEDDEYGPGARRSGSSSNGR